MVKIVPQLDRATSSRWRTAAFGSAISSVRIAVAMAVRRFPQMGDRQLL